MPQTIMLASCALLFAAYLLSVMLRKARPSLLPPGLRPLPFIGNILDTPQVQPWIQYRQWSIAFSKCVYCLL